MYPSFVLLILYMFEDLVTAIVVIIRIMTEKTTQLIVLCFGYTADAI